jgi:DNA adenine methylase
LQYFGGKARLSKEIVQILNKYRNNQPFLEPFLGGANIASKMTGERHASDINSNLIEMYKELQKGWIPPEIVTEQDYENAKLGKSEPCLTAFIGFGCSYSGKYFGGYARNKRGDNFARNAKNSLLRKMKTLRDVKFECLDYRCIDVTGFLIYCDPPYRNVTQYSSGAFNSEEFWNWCRKTGEKNTLIISEYHAPEDFQCIWEKQTKTEIRTSMHGREDRLERLFICY